MTLLASIVGSILCFLLFKHTVARIQARRRTFIRSYVFPTGLIERFAARHPQLSTHDRHLVSRALRQFFLAYLAGGRRFVSMPSQAADDLWHEFILYTRHYQDFCRRAFGRFLHHTPAVVLGPDRQSNAGLRRAWWFACQEERIDPKKPTRLPLLFALDERLGIEDGFHYGLDCHRLRRHDESAPIHCVGDFLSDGLDGSASGFGDSGFGDGDSWFGDWGGGDGGDGGDGGGCGGD